MKKMSVVTILLAALALLNLVGTAVQLGETT